MTKLSVEERRVRIRGDLLNFCHDAIALAYSRLKAELLQVYREERTDTGQMKLENYTRSTIFADAWTIVDRAHLWFQIFQKEKVPLNAASKQQVSDIGGAICKLRNGMDHIADSIHNLTNMTNSPFLPLGGVVTASFLENEPYEARKPWLETIIISTTDFHHKIHFNPFPLRSELYSINREIDHICLYGYGSRLNLSRSVPVILGMIRQQVPESNADPSNDRFTAIVRMTPTNDTA